MADIKDKIKKITDRKDIESDSVKQVFVNLTPDELAAYLPAITRQKLSELQAEVDKRDALIESLEEKNAEMQGNVKTEHEQRLDAVLEMQNLRMKQQVENSLWVRFVEPGSCKPMEIRVLSKNRRKFKAVNERTGKFYGQPYLWGVELVAKGNGGYKANPLFAEDYLSSKPSGAGVSPYTMSGLALDLVNEAVSGIVTLNIDDRCEPMEEEVNTETYRQNTQGRILYLQQELASKMDEISQLKKILNNVQQAEEETLISLEEEKSANDVLLNARKSLAAVAKKAIDQQKKVMADYAELAANAQQMGFAVKLTKERNDAYERALEDLRNEFSDAVTLDERGVIEDQTEDRVYRAMSKGLKLAPAPEKESDISKSGGGDSGN